MDWVAKTFEDHFMHIFPIFSMIAYLKFLGISISISKEFDGLYQCWAKHVFEDWVFPRTLMNRVGKS